MERAPQQCFVKRVVELDDGTLQITAARITRSRVRDDFPELHILDYDTGSYVADRLAEEVVY
jgi:RecB family exonuclease